MPNRAKRLGIFASWGKVLGMTQKTEHEFKLEFAALLQRVPKDKRLQAAPQIAKEVFGEETTVKYPVYVIKCAEEWPFDPIVIAEVDRLDLIPIPKEVILKDVYTLATDKFAEIKDRVSAFRLYADMNGWIIKEVKKDEDKEGPSRTQELADAILYPVDTSQQLPASDEQQP